MINVGDDQITALFAGDMGIKTVAIGDEIIYTRPGGYLYICLETEDTE